MSVVMSARKVFKWLAGLGFLCLTVSFFNQKCTHILEQKTKPTVAVQASVKNTNDVEELDDVLNEIHRLIDEDRKIVYGSILGGEYPNGRYNIAPRKLEDLVIVKNSRPVRSIILTTWRSGSSFLGDIIGAHPENFCHFEPLVDIGMVKIRGPPLARIALQRIRGLLNCEYADLPDSFLKFGKNHPYYFKKATYLWERCEADRICFDHRYISALCKLLPLKSTKITRLRLRLAEELLDDKKLNVKIVLLVRDPRGTMQSRKHLEFCREGPDCTETALLCADLASDYKVAVDLRKKYPTTFRVIRYEDLAADPYGEAERLYEFFGRDFHPKVREFLDTHTTTDIGDQFNTTRNSKTAPYHWRAELEFEEVKEIQRICAVAMEYWGYVPAMNGTHQRKFNPVSNYVLNL